MSVGSRGGFESQWVRGHVGEDAGGDIRDVLESHPLEANPGLLLQPMHHRIPETPLVPEVAVHRSLVHPCLFGDAADRERAPVPDGGVVEQPASRRNDSFTGLDRALAA